MNILLASSEVYPYSKTGGLADMVGALAGTLACERGGAELAGVQKGVRLQGRTTHGAGECLSRVVSGLFCNLE